MGMVVLIDMLILAMMVEMTSVNYATKCCGNGMVSGSCNFNGKSSDDG